MGTPLIITSCLTVLISFTKAQSHLDNNIPVIGNLRGLTSGLGLGNTGLGTGGGLDLPALGGLGGYGGLGLGGTGLAKGGGYGPIKGPLGVGLDKYGLGGFGLGGLGLGGVSNHGYGDKYDHAGGKKIGSLLLDKLGLGHGGSLGSLGHEGIGLGPQGLGGLNAHTLDLLKEKLGLGKGGKSGYGGLGHKDPYGHHDHHHHHHGHHGHQGHYDYGHGYGHGPGGYGYGGAGGYPNQLVRGGGYGPGLLGYANTLRGYGAGSGPFRNIIGDDDGVDDDSFDD